MTDLSPAAQAVEAVGPSDEQIDEVFEEFGEYFSDDDCKSMGWSQFRKAARCLLARYGSTPPRPVPVSERPWEREGWCDARGLCWWALGTVQRWTLCRPHDKTAGWLLPAHALPIPQESTP